MDGITKELVAAINGAVQNGEFREQGVVEEGRIDVYAIHFIDVEVVGVVKHIRLILSFRLHDGRLFFVGERFIDLLRKVV